MRHVLPALLLTAIPLLPTSPAYAFGKKPQKLGSIRAEPNVPVEQIQQLRSDFDWLANLENKSTSTELLDVMELKNASPSTLSSWLSARVRYVMAEDFQPSLLNVRPLFFKKVHYPATPLPEIELPEGFEFGQTLSREEWSEEETAPDEAGPQIIMSNLGSALYLGGKSSNISLGLKVRGVGKVAITSPRVGVIQIGSGLFSDKLFDASISKESPIRRTFRLETFFHEARHSDGNGKSLGFVHALCPAGHDYANSNACDRSTNGPYTVGAVIAEHLAVNCSHCSDQEREVMRLIALDSRSRIIPAQDGSPAASWDATPEGDFGSH